ncbi:leucine-rich repeat-containing protein 69 isoform X2 [Suncus etruscus]|uniref:leucine-rich repeat-containing protein 69 isoform X2 n=1 Tax=Suncus etruscus TaxID=109475 RepID=UPI002110A52D|nr:leucine-rich repeat-containing protein 69 isoform X2 [Suncus etruscus]
MAEKLLLRALKGGGNTKIVTLNGKRLTKMPAGLEYLTGLRKLDLQNNLISHISEEIKYLTQFQNINLKEFYCEGNPLFLKQPFKATQEIYVWSLQEIAARFITYQLAVKNDFLMQAIKWYPQIKDLISQARTCTICGKSFLTTWLECVEFVPPNKNWKTSGNLHLVPLRVLICSYKCFGLRNKNVFGIAKV